MCEHSQEQFNFPIYINHMVNAYIKISHSKVNHLKQKSEQAIKFLFKGSKKTPGWIMILPIVNDPNNGNVKNVVGILHVSLFSLLKTFNRLI